MWEFRGQRRPPFADPAGPDKESVWDYPRPPCMAPDARRVQVRFGDLIIADSERSTRVLETASPPTFYLPPEDVQLQLLEPLDGVSHCEWKGLAAYWGLIAKLGPPTPVAWCYANPTPSFRPISGYFSFYPSALKCYVGGERVRAQPGRFYGGWVTGELTGPFKGEPGTSHW